MNNPPLALDQGRCTPGKGRRIPITQEARWTAESVWTWRQRNNSCPCSQLNFSPPAGFHSVYWTSCFCWYYTVDTVGIIGSFLRSNLSFICTWQFGGGMGNWISHPDQGSVVVCGIFKDHASSSDYIVLSDNAIKEQWILKYTEVRGGGLIWVTIPVLMWWDWGKVQNSLLWYLVSRPGF
jgi:hypothetical protein